MIIGLAGAAGSGKDSVADILVMNHGFQRIAFADALYEEVSTAFDVPVAFLKNRDAKELPTWRLALQSCIDEAFVSATMPLRGDYQPSRLRNMPPHWWYCKEWSPRQILQWWGTDYRRAQCETYWIDKVRERLLSAPDASWVITDVRFQNEADLVREFGGQLGLVTRPGVGPVAKHVSEEFWQICNPDVVIPNDGTLDDLNAAIRADTTHESSTP